MRKKILSSTNHRYILAFLILTALVMSGCSSDGGGSDDEDDNLLTWYQDADADGYGDPSTTTTADAQPTGYVADNTDCDDDNDAIFPGAAETADDGIDQDCDGSDLLTWYADADGDGFGDALDSTTANAQPAGYVSNKTDCDDGDAAIKPGATEIADDNIDQDCDGSDLLTWYYDSDGDDYGDPSTTTTANTQPADYVADNTDCDDGDAAISPGAAEVCNDYIDNDCDLSIDCGDSADCEGATCSAGTYNSVGMGFNLVAAGTFTMGSPVTELGRSTDETQHSVTLSPFYMQTTEVTQGQWIALMLDNPSYFQACGLECPVEQVTWEDANDFIAALNALNEGTYRLPTEAEWEYASRAGSTDAFANGDITQTLCVEDANLNVLAWYCFNSAVAYDGCFDLSTSGGPECAGPKGVGIKDANALGLYDMHGNVWEWCSDWYGAYPASPVTDPTGPADGTGRIIRGGSWASQPPACRSAKRFSSDNLPVVPSVPAGTARDLGFRVVLEP